MSRFSAYWTLSIVLTIFIVPIVKAQEVVQFEDESVFSPSKSRYKGTKDGLHARVSSFGTIIGPVIDSVPLLLPADTSMLSRMQFMSDSYSYSAYLPQTGYVLAIFGTRRVAVPIDSASVLAQPQGNSKYSIEKTETGYQLTFDDFGAHYLIAIECQNRNDMRCAKSTFLLRAAERLAVYDAT